MFKAKNYSMKKYFNQYSAAYIFFILSLHCTPNTKMILKNTKTKALNILDRCYYILYSLRHYYFNTND